MLVLVLIGICQLVVLVLIWSALLELLEQRPTPEERSLRSLQAMELGTVRAMFQAARQAGAIDGSVEP